MRDRIPQNKIKKEKILFYTDRYEEKLDEKSFLPQEINNKIFGYMATKSCVESLKDVAQRINALAQTNRFLNKVINDDDKTLALIKQISQQFDCPNIDVARVLCTQAAKNRFALQDLFFSESREYPLNIEVLSELKNKGVDLNFSYSTEQSTQLIDLSRRGALGLSIVYWLIENGADINICTKNGHNSSMIALASYNDKLLNKFLDHPALEVNHQDNDCNTLLHCCFDGLMKNTICGMTVDKKRVPHICEIIQKLLKNGVNPTVINKDGHTPLDLAKKLSCQPIIDLLEQAIAEFNFKKNNIKDSSS